MICFSVLTQRHKSIVNRDGVSKIEVTYLGTYYTTRCRSPFKRHVQRINFCASGAEQTAEKNKELCHSSAPAVSRAMRGCMKLKIYHQIFSLKEMRKLPCTQDHQHRLNFTGNYYYENYVCPIIIVPIKHVMK